MVNADSCIFVTLCIIYKNHSKFKQRIITDIIVQVEKSSAYELEVGTRRVTADINRLEEQARRDGAALERAEQEVRTGGDGRF